MAREADRKDSFSKSSLPLKSMTVTISFTARRILTFEPLVRFSNFKKVKWSEFVVEFNELP